MSFEIRIVSNTPLTGENDLERATKMFLYQIGYLSKGADPDIPFKIFFDFFLKHPTKAWMVEEIANQLKVSKPTIYRHLNKLKGLDILEDVQVTDETGQRGLYGDGAGARSDVPEDAPFGKPELREGYRPDLLLCNKASPVSEFLLRDPESPLRLPLPKEKEEAQGRELLHRAQL